MWDGVLIGLEKPCDTESFILGLPSFPLLVVTMITPFAPLAPKTAVAEASLRTEMFSTSSGSMDAKSRSTPSTRTRGLLLPKLETPRMTISASLLPGWPEDCIVVTPESLPERALVMLETPELTRVSPCTCEIAPTTLSFFCTPYPTTTTSSRRMASSLRTIEYLVCDVLKTTF